MSPAREDFIAKIVHELYEKGRTWHFPAEFARDVLRRAKNLHSLAEKACNQGLTPRETGRQYRLKHKIKKLCRRFKVEPVFQDDPRGAVVKLKVPSGATDDMGRTGICVPTF